MPDLCAKRCPRKYDYYHINRQCLSSNGLLMSISEHHSFLKRRVSEMAAVGLRGELFILFSWNNLLSTNDMRLTFWDGDGRACVQCGVGGASYPLGICLHQENVGVSYCSLSCKWGCDSRIANDWEMGGRVRVLFLLAFFHQKEKKKKTMKYPDQ